MGLCGFVCGCGLGGVCVCVGGLVCGCVWFGV